jgi:hypothetical protein
VESHLKLYNELTIEFRENRRSNQEWTIQRNWQCSAYKTQDEDKQNKKHNTTQKTVFEIMRAQGQITQRFILYILLFLPLKNSRLTSRQLY